MASSSSAPAFPDPLPPGGKPFAESEFAIRLLRGSREDGKRDPNRTLLLFTDCSPRSLVALWVCAKIADVQAIMLHVHMVVSSQESADARRVLGEEHVAPLLSEFQGLAATIHDQPPILREIMHSNDDLLRFDVAVSLSATELLLNAHEYDGSLARVPVFIFVPNAEEYESRSIAMNLVHMGLVCGFICVGTDVVGKGGVNVSRITGFNGGPTIKALRRCLNGVMPPADGPVQFESSYMLFFGMKHLDKCTSVLLSNGKISFARTTGGALHREGCNMYVPKASSGEADVRAFLTNLGRV